jgi:biopolymer transport protein ExbD
VKLSTEETLVSKPEINVTPLIDVLLVLLIIFMVITPIKPSAFEARLPAEPINDPNIRINPDTLVVTVGRDSSLQLNYESLDATVDDPAKLINRLREVFDGRELNHAYVEGGGSEMTPHIQRTVFIKAPRGLPYGSFAKVVDAVKVGGARPISLQIDDLD